MNREYGGLSSIALRSNRILQALSLDIDKQRKELNLTEYHQTYTRNQTANLSGLTRFTVEQSIKDMEAAGYEFNKKQVGNVNQYALTPQNVIDIYHHRKFKKYRDTHSAPFVVFVVNLKGGVSKTVSVVTLAHALRVHPDLLQQDLRILVIDMDSQASATMFLDHEKSYGDVAGTAAQAMLNDVDLETLRSEVIRPTLIPGVDIIPASIDDGFIASSWNELVAEHLPGMKPSEVLKKTIIDKVANDYDFILIDTGPHLDAFMLNGLAASDILLTPTPPAQVDFHSTMKYLIRLPEIIEQIEREGVEPKIITNIGFMSKITPGKRDHEVSHSMARQVFGANMLDCSLPRLEGFERCGESFDTVISANPTSYPGSETALKKARVEGERFAKAVFDRIEFIRGEVA